MPTYTHIHKDYKYDWFVYSVIKVIKGYIKDQKSTCDIQCLYNNSKLHLFVQ